jgi:hypothetical protein
LSKGRKLCQQKKYQYYEVFYHLKFACSHRAGIADGGEFYIRQPELLPGFLIKLNIKN